MFERFTDEGRSVVVWAQEEVVALRHKQIGTEHLLLGVLRISDPPLQTAISAAGITLDSVRERVVESVGRSRKGPTGHIPFTPSAKQVLERPVQVSKHLGHTGIGPAHLLVAILQTRDRTAVRVLVGLDVDTVALAVAAGDVASGVATETRRAGRNPDQGTGKSLESRSAWTEGVGKIFAERAELAAGLIRYARYEPEGDPAQNCSCGLAGLLEIARSVFTRGQQPREGPVAP
jgi:ATP-dependent Clp protease ATP-binding subunit ClpC